MKKWVSEIVTQDEIKKWNNGDVITITAGTGAGKSRFIKVSLYAHAKAKNKKILFLIHRTNCVNQFQLEIEEDKKTDVIDIKTYQSIESTILKNGYYDFSIYQYIVCDEFHYFISDASMNKTTDMSLNAILKQTNQIKIMMSATGNKMKKYLNNFKKITTIAYGLPITYDFIQNLTIFYKDSTIEMFIQESIKRNEKAIFFIQSAKKAYELYEKYKDYAIFNCSKSNQYYKYVDKDKIESMLKNQRFEELILITTTTMDAGVNIIDTSLKHIICDVKDTDTMIQCIGRKRIQNVNDKIQLYIKNINNQVLGGKQTQLNKKREMAKYLKEHTIEEYIHKYFKENDKYNMVYDVLSDDKKSYTKKINWLMYFKCLIDLTEIDKIKSYDDKFGYSKYIADLFGIEKYRLIEEENQRESLEQYLDSIVGKKLYKDEQKELINVVGLKDARCRLQKSIKQLNLYFEENKIPYIIIPKKSCNSRFWIVETIER